ncbi:MAG: D-sedoheptulose 7-phosphate isomerase [Candidatus Saganbacteria bacterium]|nr:D-sedoheptulose 7-phosphate isomerase [Candidatus Saganbacteria bacterium]
MQEIIKKELQAGISLKQQVLNDLVPQIEQAAKIIIGALKKGNKIMLFGNGGSAADAQHLAGELVGRFLKDRSALPAIALSTDTSVLTCLANDFGYETVFARQIEALAKPGDIAFGLSTSGNSLNVMLALEKAEQIGCKTIGLLGKDGGKIAGKVDLALTVRSQATPRVQECHITIGHIICGLVEQEIFAK